MRTLLLHLHIESFLEPRRIDDIAIELVICCTEAFHDLIELSKIAPSTKMEVESDELPAVMDVFLYGLLSMLATGSTPVPLSSENVKLLMI